jgi:hypothetical protein
MKIIKNFGDFVNESYDSIFESKSESQFISKLTSLSKPLLNKAEKKESHFIHDFILDKIYSIYDSKFASKEDLSDKDYKEALDLLKDKIEEFRNSKKYEREQAKFSEKQEKLKKKKAEGEEKFKQQELAAGRTYTPPSEKDDDDDDDDDDDEE